MTKHSMILTISLLGLSLMHCNNSENDLRAVDLSCEQLSNPLSINTLKPDLSWKIEGEGRTRRQTAYQILVASSAEKLQNDVGDLWNSTKVLSDESIHVYYKGTALQSGNRCYWKVPIWDEKDNVSDWSSTNLWEQDF